jgi:Zn-dependent protease
MSFRLFGVNVEIQLSFWITTVLLALPDFNDPTVPKASIAVWVAVVLVSVLVHEYGHAFAVMRHRIEPEITLYGMGGLTRYQPLIPLRRLDNIIISLAGPFAGFALGGLLLAAMWIAPGFFARLPQLGRIAVSDLLWVNFGWGLVNLLPVLPFDGGHVLENALGPRRSRLTAGISMVVAFLIAAFFVYLRSVWGALLFGLSAMQSYRRFSEETPEPRGSKIEEDPDAVAPEILALLQTARHAIANDQLDRAAELAQRALEGDGGTVPVSRRARLLALEVIAWTHLLAAQAADRPGAVRDDRVATAAEVLAEARKHGEPDPALTGAILFAQNDLAKARQVLEKARQKGDDRKEVIGPLVQILIAEGQIGEAASIALSIVDSLSDEDARKMATLAYEHRAWDGAAKLWEALFDRNKSPDDAYDAARAAAQSGKHERALDLLRRAVEAGFTDRARAWSDAALATLQSRPGLEAVLPRP